MSGAMSVEELIRRTRAVEATAVIRFRQVDAIRLGEIREPPSVLHELDADASKVHAVIQAGRPGAQKFVTILEHEHYSPITGREPLLEARAVVWIGLSWMLLSIPFPEWRLLHEVAARCRMRLADGVPLAIGAAGACWWPMRSSRVANVENLDPPPDDPARMRALLEAEDAECEAIREATRRRYREEILGRN